jgi:hypothetical protein
MTLEIIQQILLGGLLGLVGQGLRIIVGIKKVNDEAQIQKLKVANLIEVSRIWISLLIGFLAGCLALVAMSNFMPDFFTGPNAKQHILALIAAGYAGADFIEGLIKKYFP